MKITFTLLLLICFMGTFAQQSKPKDLFLVMETIEDKQADRDEIDELAEEEELVIMRLRHNAVLSAENNRNAIAKENRQLSKIRKKVDLERLHLQKELDALEEEHYFLEEENFLKQEKRASLVRFMKSLADENDHLIQATNDDEVNEEMVRINRELIQEYEQKIMQFDHEIEEGQYKIYAQEGIRQEIADRLDRNEEIAETCLQMVEANEAILSKK